MEYTFYRAATFDVNLGHCFFVMEYIFYRAGTCDPSIEKIKTRVDTKIEII
jgi:hypothetical protein